MNMRENSEVSKGFETSDYSYLWNYSGIQKTKNNFLYYIRPIIPADLHSMAEFHDMLSPETVYSRYGHTISLEVRKNYDRLMRRCNIKYKQEMRLVVINDTKIIGVGHLAKCGTGMGEIALLVADEFQHKGIGTFLTYLLLKYAKDEGLQCVVAYTCNNAMIHILKRHGFEYHRPDSRYEKILQH